MFAIALTRLWWNELEVEGTHHEVDDEEKHERDDHGLVHRVTHALRTTGRVHALVRRDDAGDQTEHERFRHALIEVWQLGERGEARQVGTGGAVLEDDVEEVTAADADDADQAVEE